MNTISILGELPDFQSTSAAIVAVTAVSPSERSMMVLSTMSVAAVLERCSGLTRS